MTCADGILNFSCNYHKTITMIIIESVIVENVMLSEINALLRVNTRNKKASMVYLIVIVMVYY
jgi:hypothetical protein